MDEPEEPQEETGQRSGVLAAVLLVLAAAFLVALLLGAWHTRGGATYPSGS